MHYLQPLAEFLAQNWWVWLFCTLITFAINVRLVPKKDDEESRHRSARFLRGTVEFAMWMFGILLVASLIAFVGQQFGLW
jgi:hypothetical protein